MRGLDVGNPLAVFGDQLRLLKVCEWLDAQKDGAALASRPQNSNQCTLGGSRVLGNRTVRKMRIKNLPTIGRSTH